MSTAAVAADALGRHRSPEATPPRRRPAPAHLKPVPAAHTEAPTTPAARAEAPITPATRAGSPVSPAPTVAPRRRPQIEGATTDRMPVRGCSGDDLGRRAAVQPEPATLRLTRRGRMLLTAVSVLVFGAAILVLGLRVAGVLEPGPHFTHTVPVQVAPGQTLWSIAQDTNPGQDPAAVVEKIADVNNLATPADIIPGQTLQIPVAG
ncbi:LysM peptidoglycan-binding domain-containing protein [Kribbella sp. VKM Ac-2566]|uniref:LysM peptidoglycan-binding domain-containing protein n=1 Tax=Kribbella sp. VKM Ac-2566 TaxID=2512218 RepID=UPI0010DDD8B2|nr:LysM peptidoglycan-binding domain-containing protein [Kribbella sp. VKM Ac-2566]TDW83756.1 LysM domain-containing protein [Kribbella sp. VKM Ac-2566]